jgi:hypothetical protein
MVYSTASHLAVHMAKRPTVGRGSRVVESPTITHRPSTIVCVHDARVVLSVTR